MEETEQDLDLSLRLPTWEDVGLPRPRTVASRAPAPAHTCPLEDMRVTPGGVYCARCERKVADGL